MIRPAFRTLAATVALCFASIGCGGRVSSQDTVARAGSRADANTAAQERSDRTTAVDDRPKVVVLGDSLTAGLGLEPAQSYPALLQQRIDSAGLHYQVVNAGVSGDTSAGGLSRLDWALDGNVRVLIVALGGNDGLRGLPPEELQRNLAAIVERAQAKHVTVILAGMEAPPNFGERYVVSFRQVYPALARAYHVVLIPFLLEGVAGSDTLNQADGIHPTADGARIVAETVWRALAPAIEKDARTK